MRERKALSHDILQLNNEDYAQLSLPLFNDTGKATMQLPNTIKIIEFAEE